MLISWLYSRSQVQNMRVDYSQWLMMKLVSMLCITRPCHVTSLGAVIQISMSSRLIRYVFTWAKTALVAELCPLSLACSFDIWAVFLDLALHALPLMRWIDEIAFCLLFFMSCFILKNTIIQCLVYGLWLTRLCWVIDSKEGFCPCVIFFLALCLIHFLLLAFNLIFNFRTNRSDKAY